MHERNVTSAQGTPWPWCVWLPASCNPALDVGVCFLSVVLLCSRPSYSTDHPASYPTSGGRWHRSDQPAVSCANRRRRPASDRWRAGQASTPRWRRARLLASYDSIPQREASAMRFPAHLFCAGDDTSSLTHRMRRDGGGAGAMRAGAFSLPLPLLCPLAMPHAIIARPSMSISWVSSHAIEIARVRFATAARGAARHGTHRACAPIRASGRQCSCVREDQLAWFEPVRPGLHGKECERSCLYLSTSSSCFFQYKVL